MKKQYCESCGKLYNEAEYLVGQCNDCDPFEDPDLMFELFGEPNYLDELTTPWSAEVIEAIFGIED